MEKALREQKEYLRLILDNIPLQVFWKDVNLVFLGCNQNWAKAAEMVHPEAVVGKTDYDVLPNREIADLFRVQDRRIMETMTPELHIVASKPRPSADGQTVWLDISKIPLQDSTGKVIGILGVVEDITLRKKAEEALRVEQEKSERLLLNILPKAIAEQLKQNLWNFRENGFAKPNGAMLIAEQFDEVTIMFADIVGFTPLSARISPQALVNLLNEIFSTFDELAEKHGLEKIKTIGDAYMVAGGLPMPIDDDAEPISHGDIASRTAQMALDMQTAITQFEADKGEPFQIRIGINTGPVVAGVIGIKKFIYDLWGDTVNVASRMESQGMPGRIQVTATTYERLQDQYLLEERGTIPVKGKGEMTTYWLIGSR
jgi:PAS domain S-box-containing protein